MAHLLNFPGDIKSNPVDASKLVVLKPTEKEIVLPDIKMHVDDEILVSLYHMDSQVSYADGFTEQLGGMVVKTTDDAKITIHNATTMHKVRTIDTGFKRSIRRLLVWDGPKPNGPQIIACSGDGTIKVFDFDGRPLRDLAKPPEGTKGREKIGHVGKVMCIAVSKDEPYERTYVASGGVDCSVRIWGLKSGKQQAECKGHTKEIIGVNFCKARNGTPLVGSMDFGGEVRLWDRETGELMRIIDAPDVPESKRVYY
jgi:WD40 repeat protein